MKLYTPLLLLIIILGSQQVDAQSKKDSTFFRSPLDIPLTYAATFAELRENHFHSGVDFKVGGVIGAKIYAPADGYISRIRISPTGFGKALYLDHPNGTTTVYGHLDDFCPKIKQYIEDIMYKQEKSEIDRYLGAAVLPVKKGELIGYVGNTGSSGGPHLHFEIREKNTQNPLNIVPFGFKTNDTLCPKIFQVAVFTIDTLMGNVPVPRELQRFTPVLQKGGKYKLNEKNLLTVGESPLYFAIHYNDYHNDSPNHLGIYEMKGEFDGTPFFGFVLSKISFDVTRHLNSFVAYDLFQETRKLSVKTYIEPGNKLNVYKNIKNNGLVYLKDNEPHTVSFALTDDAGNTSELSFAVQKDEKVAKPLPDPETYRLKQVVNWGNEFTYTTDSLQVHIPEGAFYQSILFGVTKEEKSQSVFSPTYTIHQRETPLQRQMTISIKANLPEKLRAKAIVAGLNRLGNLYSARGSYNAEDGYVSTKTYSFGSYFVAIDTVAPKVTATFENGANLKGRNIIKVKVSDNLSGITSYKGYIDGKWVILEFDPKTASIACRLDSERITRGKKHTFKIVVGDSKNNTTTMETSFIW